MEGGREGGEGWREGGREGGGKKPSLRARPAQSYNVVSIIGIRGLIVKVSRFSNCVSKITLTNCK